VGGGGGGGLKLIHFKKLERWATNLVTDESGLTVEGVLSTLATVDGHDRLIEDKGKKSKL